MVFDAFYLVFENKGLIGFIRASSLENKELEHFAVEGPGLSLGQLPIAEDCRGQIAEVADRLVRGL